MMFKRIAEIYNHRELLWNLVVRNLKIRYQSSVLGFFWTLLNPLFMMLIYLVIFVHIMKIKIGVEYLLTGLIPWQFFAMSLSDAANSIVGHSNLVKKTHFPRIILPLAMVVANLINFLLSLLVLFVFLIIGNLFWKFGISFTFHLLYLPLIILFQTILCLGLALIIACSNVYFRDTEHILSITLMAWFFLTPIIYPLDLAFGALSGKLFYLYLINPMTPIAIVYRGIFLGSALDTSPFLFLSFCLPGIILAIGAYVFFKFEGDFADVL